MKKEEEDGGDQLRLFQIVKKEKENGVGSFLFPFVDFLAKHKLYHFYFRKSKFNK